MLKNQMKLIKDLGMQFPNETSTRKRRFGLYECSKCFKSFKVRTCNTKKMKSTQCKSCSSTTHRLSHHKLYTIWYGEKARCENQKNQSFENYGGRGIEVSDEFHNFPTWLEYIESLTNAYRDTYTIDRIDNNGNYERGNLRWESRSIQAQNTRLLYSHNTSGYRGVVKNGKKWKAQIKVNKKIIYLGVFDYKYTAGYAYDAYITKHNLNHTQNFNKSQKDNSNENR